MFGFWVGGQSIQGERLYKTRCEYFPVRSTAGLPAMDGGNVKGLPGAILTMAPTVL